MTQPSNKSVANTYTYTMHTHTDATVISSTTAMLNNINMTGYPGPA